MGIRDRMIIPLPDNFNKVCTCSSLSQYRSKCYAAEGLSGFYSLFELNDEYKDRLIFGLRQHFEYNRLAVYLNDEIACVDIDDAVSNFHKFGKHVYKKLLHELSASFSLADEPVCVLRVEYTSPAGRNYYCEDYSRNFSEVLDYIQCHPTVKYIDFDVSGERAKMTPSLRYEILKRDNFHCVLCGRGTEDGVKLEVDHIIPVSKGGKTEPSNLRTLCRDCNRGKSDKLED